MNTSISINGADAVDCASLGWSFETRSLRNCAPDVATLRRVREAGEAIDIAPDSKVVLFVDGVRTFTGTAQPAQFSIAENGERVTVQIFGPWWHLMAVTFCRADFHDEGGIYNQLPPIEGDTFVVGSGSGEGTQIWDGSGWVSGGAGTTYKWARVQNLSATPPEVDIAFFTGARGLLFDPNWPLFPDVYRSVYDEVSELLTYMLEVHTRLGLEAPFQVDLGQLETDLGAVATPRFRTFLDQKVATVLTTMLAIKPDASVFFDYSTEIPTLRIRVASIETTVDLAKGVAPLQRITATPRPDLQPAGIIVRWEYDEDLPYSWRGYRRPRFLDKFPLDVLPHEPWVLTHTIDAVAGIGSFQPQLAESIYNSIGILRVTGSMSLTFDNPAEAAAIRPGLCYRLAGDAALDDAQLLTQDSTWNLTTGQVDASLGYPRALALDDISALRGWVTWTVQGVFASTTTIIPPTP
ncbi:MAG: hypothetical protein V4662_17630 [Verrucomicrobiota bacterium]